MSATLGKWMTLIIAANIMFAPILAYIDSMHREAVEVVLQEGAKKASIEGSFTSTIIDDMKDELVDNFNFDRNKIEIKASTELVTRNNYIEASIKVPSGPIFVFDIFNRDNKNIIKKAKILSEYVN